jgi:hypothetical protein
MDFFTKTGRLFALLCAAPLFANPPPSVPAEAPAAALNFDASRAEYIPGRRPNGFGVYPVRIRWQKPAGASFGYRLYRSPAPDGEFHPIAQVPADAEIGGFFTVIDDNPAAKPGESYYYRLAVLADASAAAGAPLTAGTPLTTGMPLTTGTPVTTGEAAYCTESRLGYGALTPEQYMREYNKTVTSSIGKMTYMNKPGAFAKLGAEAKNGAISGSLSYRARIAGLGARVLMAYDNYADFYIDNKPARGAYFLLSGKMNTTATMTQNGRMDGTVHVTGMYPGKVHYDNRACCKSRLLLHRLLQFLRLKPYETCIFKRLLLQN